MQDHRTTQLWDRECRTIGISARSLLLWSFRHLFLPDTNKHRKPCLHSCQKCLKLLLTIAVEGRASLPGSKEGGVQRRESFSCCENSHQTPLRRGKMQQFWKYGPFLRRDLKDKLLWRTGWIWEAVTEAFASPKQEQISMPTVPCYPMQVPELLPAGSQRSDNKTFWVPLLLFSKGHYHPLLL